VGAAATMAPVESRCDVAITGRSPLRAAADWLRDHQVVAATRVGVGSADAVASLLLPFPANATLPLPSAVAVFRSPPLTVAVLPFRALATTKVPSSAVAVLLSSASAKFKIPPLALAVLLFVATAKLKRPPPAYAVLPLPATAKLNPGSEVAVALPDWTRLRPLNDTARSGVGYGSAAAWTRAAVRGPALTPACELSLADACFWVLLAPAGGDARAVGAPRPSATSGPPIHTAQIFAVDDGVKLDFTINSLISEVDPQPGCDGSHKITLTQMPIR
jgi:hypothetical protein